MVSASTKRCAKCREVKSFEDFGLQRNGKTPRGYCRTCESKHSRAWQLANPEKAAQIKHAAFIKNSKRFNLWKLDGVLQGLSEPYGRALQADPCSYCGGVAGHLDHIIPVREIKASRATRRTEWENLTATCHRCNIKKERASLLEFLVWPRGWLTST